MSIGEIPSLDELDEHCPHLTEDEKEQLIADATSFSETKKDLCTTEQKEEAWKWPIIQLGVALINQNVDHSRPIFWRQVLISNEMVKDEYKDFIEKTVRVVNRKVAVLAPHFQE